MKKLTLKSLLVGAFLLPISLALAVPITPHSDSFANLPGATYGGSGIPTFPSAISTYVDGANTITLGLTAHQRYANPALGNNGANTFSATPGANDGLDIPAQSIGSTWNFAYYINVTGPGTLANYSFRLLYDLDPGVNTDSSSLGILNLSSFAGFFGQTTTYQDSQNAMFGFLTSPILGFVTPPSFTPFNPNASGQYSFQLEVSTLAGSLLDSSAINVNVSSVPDAGSTITLLGLALTGLGFAFRRVRA